jgi:hypothetical protein
MGKREVELTDELFERFQAIAEADTLGSLIRASGMRLRDVPSFLSILRRHVRWKDVLQILKEFRRMI